jgi:hypothetical protein
MIGAEGQSIRAPVSYFLIAFTLPAALWAITYQNKGRVAQMRLERDRVLQANALAEELQLAAGQGLGPLVRRGGRDA